MFVDRVRILAKGGHGGRGGLSFFRAKHNAYGGPDGGSGGQGGDVILVVNPNLNNLVHLKYSPHQYAEDGRPGNRKQQTGRGGKDKVIEVPAGTAVRQIPLEDDQERVKGDIQPMPEANDASLPMVADMLDEGQRHVLAAGGRGGLGNMSFKSSVNQAPRKTQPGLPGEYGEFELVLKSIADVGLVGFPNAGKSTLLSRLSHAHPKIANYPFTTLTPQIGVMENEVGERLTLADIPGLIEGAHEGVGLGHEFLRHVERCRLLLFVIDMAGTDAREPLDDFRQLRTEVSLYQEELAKRPYLVVANKMDQPVAAEKLAEFRAQIDRPLLEISAQQEEGLEGLQRQLFHELLPSTAEPAQPADAS